MRSGIQTPYCCSRMAVHLSSRIAEAARMTPLPCHLQQPYLVTDCIHACLYLSYQVYALGFVSVFDQILDGFDGPDKTSIFNAYIKSLGEDPARYRSDAELLESQARALSSPDGLTPDSNGNELQKALAAVAAATEAGKFAYNRFFAVGLFR
eukprot:GHUV01040228.1.p1 GENE.GHUV01040228.1~~GHUV01040228.1.p1  ORF type:complete len:152 (-),score=31.68 GHUV01040228.1:534-989(-)